MSVEDFLRNRRVEVRANGDALTRTVTSEEARRRTRALGRGIMRPEGHAGASALHAALPEDPSEAWEACIARGLIDEAWASDPRRHFYVRCAPCRGTGKVRNPQYEGPDNPDSPEPETLSCALCRAIGAVWGVHPGPASTGAIAMLAACMPAVRTAEALAGEVLQFMNLVDRDLHWRFVDHHDLVYSPWNNDYIWPGFVRHECWHWHSEIPPKLETLVRKATRGFSTAADSTDEAAVRGAVGKHALGSFATHLALRDLILPPALADAFPAARTVHTPLSALFRLGFYPRVIEPIGGPAAARLMLYCPKVTS